MPQTKTKQPAARASRNRKPKAPAKHAWQANNIGQTLKTGDKERLNQYVGEFLETGRAEEIRFLAQVFHEWDQAPKGVHDYEVPLFSAIQTAITDNIEHVIALPDSDMLRPVTDFIEGLENAAETDPKALAVTPRPETAIRTRRVADLKHFIEKFCTTANDGDLFFLETVLARWDGILEFLPEDQPQSPIMSALQYELDHEHWVIKAPAGSGRTEYFKTLVGLMQREGWLGDLLSWIAMKYETVTPCDVGKEAFRHQAAFDKAEKAA